MTQGQNYVATANEHFARRMLIEEPHCLLQLLVSHIKVQFKNSVVTPKLPPRRCCHCGSL